MREQTESLPELMPAVERLIKQTEPLSELLPALESLKKELGEQLERLRELIVALEGDESHLNVTAGTLVDELVAMHKTVSGLQNDVQSVTERLPDPSKGPLQKAHGPHRRCRQPKPVAHTRRPPREPALEHQRTPRVGKALPGSDRPRDA